MALKPMSNRVRRTKSQRTKTPRVGQKVTLKPTKPGQKSISFKKGGLHSSLGVPQGQKIPASKKAAALAGKYGKRAQAQARFAKNVLTGK